MAKVEAGFVSFTEVTDPGEHRSYNAWHQLDHLPEQLPLAGIAHGQRWVSTPRCRAGRHVSEGELDATHYLTLYLISPPVERALEEFLALGARLGEARRFHRHRRSHWSGPLALERVLAAPRVLVSAEAVPYRPHRGVFAVVDERGDGGPVGAPAIDPDHYEETRHRPGVAGIWSFATPGPSGPGHRPGPARRLDVYWLDGEVHATADALGRACVAASEAAGARTRFAGAFETITPGEWDWFDAPA